MAQVHSRYARAFADVVMDRKLDPRKTVEDLRAMAALIEEVPQLRNILDNPSVPAGQKRAVLDKIVAHMGADRMVRNFLAVIVDQRRIAALPEIVRQFQAELNQRMGLAEAEVTSARELGDDEKRALEAQIAKLTGKRVMATYRRDEKVLGGAVVKVGSTIYDGSVRGQLQRLKEELSTG